MEKPLEILERFPVRKTKKQKQAFRAEAIAYLQRQGYSCHVETGVPGVRNLVAGEPEQAEYLITAHYDTCAWLPFPNLAFPCSLTMTVLWQIAVTLLMLVIPTVLAAGLWWLTGVKAAFWTVWGLLILTETMLVIAGPANRHCVNDNTSGVITALEIAAALPERAREKVCIVLFDLEEAGLLGSMAYRSAHKQASETQLVLNFDCVGDGDHIAMLPNKLVKEDPAAIAELRRCGGWYGDKRIFVWKKKFSSYASDQKNFPRGVGICALRRKGNLLYLGRIHTQRDTILEPTNVNLLRTAIVSMISVKQ